MTVKLVDTELYHYGVPGMKWGVRKDRRGVGKKRNRFITNAVGGLKTIGDNRRKSSEADKVSKSRRKAVQKKNLKTMSSEEIKNRTDRLNAEKKLRDLTFEMEATPAEKRAKAVGKTAADAGSKAAKVAITAIAGAATVAALAYIGRKIQSQAIYDEYTAKGSPSDIKKWAADSAKVLKKDPEIIEDIIANQGAVEIKDPMTRAAVLEDAAAFVKAAYKKGK